VLDGLHSVGVIHLTSTDNAADAVRRAPRGEARVKAAPLIDVQQAEGAGERSGVEEDRVRNHHARYGCWLRIARSRVADASCTVRRSRSRVS
jgi:hypothetical protein